MTPPETSDCNEIALASFAAPHGSGAAESYATSTDAGPVDDDQLLAYLARRRKTYKLEKRKWTKFSNTVETRRFKANMRKYPVI